MKDLKLKVQKFLTNYYLLITNYSPRRGTGFTLIELLVVVVIIGVLVTIGIASYNNFNATQTLAQTANNLKINLRLAQSRAFEGVNSSSCSAVNPFNGWKVNLSANPLYLTAVCGEGASESEVGTKKTFSLGSVAYGSGPTELRFLPLSRGVDIAGSVTLELSLAGVSSPQTIIITSTGEIR